MQIISEGARLHCVFVDLEITYDKRWGVILHENVGSGREIRENSKNMYDDSTTAR